MSTNAVGRLQVQFRTNSLRVNTEHRMNQGENSNVPQKPISNDNMYQTFFSMIYLEYALHMRCTIFKL